MRGLIILAIVISAVVCQKPTPCVTPAQWEGRYIIKSNNKPKPKLSPYYKQTILDTSNMTTNETKRLEPESHMTPNINESEL